MRRVERDGFRRGFRGRRRTQRREGPTDEMRIGTHEGSTARIGMFVNWDQQRKHVKSRWFLEFSPPAILFGRVLIMFIAKSIKIPTEGVFRKAATQRFGTSRAHCKPACPSRPSRIPSRTGLCPPKKSSLGDLRELVLVEPFIRSVRGAPGVLFRHLVPLMAHATGLHTEASSSRGLQGRHPKNIRKNTSGHEPFADLQAKSTLSGLRSRCATKLVWRKTKAFSSCWRVLPISCGSGGMYSFVCPGASTTLEFKYVLQVTKGALNPRHRLHVLHNRCKKTSFS